jgi:branched-chain amino acid transport system ATP-binding protein
MTQTSNQVLLKISDLKVAYGGIQAVKGVSLEVRQGELVTLIGSNGAGKTTTMKAITGGLKPNAGTVEYGAKRRRLWRLGSRQARPGHGA